MIVTLPICLQSLRKHRAGLSQPNRFLWSHLDTDFICDLTRDRTLQCKYVPEITIVGPGPKICVLGCVDQLRSDANPITGTLHRPFYYSIHTQLASNLWNGFIGILISVNRRMGDYLQ